jgi:hypothetical protein
MRAHRQIHGLILAALSAVVLVAGALPAAAQETVGQFNATNAENRRHSAAQDQLSNDAQQLQRDESRGLIGCQGAGSSAAANACGNTVELGIQRRGIMLNNQALQEQNAHANALRTIGVNPLQ